MIARDPTRDLRRLAALYGVQPSFMNMHWQRQWSPPEALLAVLRDLGAPLERLEDAGNAIRERKAALAARFLEPVIVAWDGDSSALRIKVPVADAHRRMSYHLMLESGEMWSGSLSLESAPVQCRFSTDGVVFLVRSFLPPKRLPLGYHRLEVGIGADRRASLVISAPLRMAEPAQGSNHRSWGLFAPLYALHSDRDWGVGDFTDAEALVSWMKEAGGSLFGTLPFLAGYLDTPCDPSPYTPASRLFWNELFVDVSRLPELASNHPAQQVIAWPAFQEVLRGLRAGKLVDHRGAMAAKRQILKLLAPRAMGNRGPRGAAIHKYLGSHPELARYARFRAVTTRQQTAWTRWPQRIRDGEIRDGDFDPEEECYHLYAQFVTDEQIATFAGGCRKSGVELYLDFPLGTHPGGYDVWRWREIFATGCSVGAPPDPVFTTGQDWGFPPLRPESLRESGYAYLIDCLRHQLRHATILRLDHVMGLHRTYWIPQGFLGTDGVYVRYRSDELYAIALSEAHRAKARLVGENLGIVPGYVNRALARHSLVGMNVAYWELAVDPDGAMHRLSERPKTVASLNTHDMFPFAAFWEGHDIDERQRLGMISADDAEAERKQREQVRTQLSEYIRSHGLVTQDPIDAAAALRALLTLLGRSAAEYVLINIEDLWLETSPQNIPSTVDERPNWRQKTRLSLEEIIRSDGIREQLSGVNQLRRGQED